MRRALLLALAPLAAAAPAALADGRPPEGVARPVAPPPPAPPAGSAAPSLAKWQADMTTYGRRVCATLTDPARSFNGKLRETHYDAERVFLQIAAYTGDGSWLACAKAARSVYGDTYVLNNGGRVPGYWAFWTGLALDFQATADGQALAELSLLARNAAYAPDFRPAAWTKGSTMSREVASNLEAQTWAELLGAPHRARTDLLLNQAYGHLDQWFVSRTAPYVRPFMVGLTAGGVEKAYLGDGKHFDQNYRWSFDYAA